MVTATSQHSERDKMQARILNQADDAWCLVNHMRLEKKDSSREHEVRYDEGTVSGRTVVCITHWSKDISPQEFRKFTDGWHEYMPKATDAGLTINHLKELDRGRQVYLHRIKTPFYMSDRSVIHVYYWINNNKEDEFTYI